MRALCTIAFILSFCGYSHAQVSDVEASDNEETQAGDAPTPMEASAPPADAHVVDIESVEDAGETPAVERVEYGEAIQGIQRVERRSADSDDDRPPALRREEQPPARGEPTSRERPSPWRGYFGASTGLALHLNPRDEFQQSVVAPSYLHLRGGAVLPGQGALRHGLQLGVSTNLSREGVYPSGVLALRQWVVVPSYVLRLGLDSSPIPTWIATARVGVPVVVSPDATIGAELAVGAQYFARAGFAVFAEVIYDVFVGGRVRDGSRSIHHLLTLEVGVQFELEVLP